MNKNSKILLTGSGGVLGKAILSELEVQGYINVLAPNRNELDLLQVSDVMDYVAVHQPEVVIHLASLVYGLAGNMNNQMQSLYNNTAINNNLFFALSNNSNVKQVFFAGTVAAYPYPFKSLPLVETEFTFEKSPHFGEYGYAMSKRHALSYLKLLSDLNNVRYVYGVFTNLYGEDDRFDTHGGHVIPSLVAKAFVARDSGKPLEVWGDGSAVRDFMYSQDAARAVIHCLSVSKEDQIINISTSKGVSIAEVANEIAKCVGVSRVVFQSDKPTGIVNRVVNNERLVSLGFESQIDMHEGIARVCEWYEKNQEKVRV